MFRVNFITLIKYTQTLDYFDRPQGLVEPVSQEMEKAWKIP